MGDLDPEKTLEIDRLLDELSEKKAKIELIEWRQEAEAVLEELREVKDDFIRLLKTVTKIMSERDREVWESLLLGETEDQGHGPEKKC